MITPIVEKGIYSRFTNCKFLQKVFDQHCESNLWVSFLWMKFTDVQFIQKYAVTISLTFSFIELGVVVIKILHHNALRFLAVIFVQGIPISIFLD